MRWYPHSGTGPLDLVLYGHYNHVHLDAALCNELQDRAERDVIRRLHLHSENSELLSSIISLLTVKCEGTRSNNVESFILWNRGGARVDLSDFFSHCRFLKLRHLFFTRCTFSSWDRLASLTGALTTLDLATSFPSPSPTTSQLLSILASNPLLRKIGLDRRVIPDDDGDRSSFRVPLRHLDKLELTGDLQDVFRFLHRLDHPKNMYCLVLELENCLPVEVSQLIGPYVRDYLRGRDRSRNGLELSLSSLSSLSSDRGINLHVSDAPGTTFQPADTFVGITVGLNEVLPGDALEEVTLDLIAHVPGQEIVHFTTVGILTDMGNIYPRFPNLRTLSFDGILLSAAFPEPDRNNGALISLQHISFRDLVTGLGDWGLGDWGPLTTFLACRASSGNQLNILEISGSPHMCSATVEVIRGMVGEFKIGHQNPLCPFCTCPEVSTDWSFSMFPTEIF